MLKMQAEVFEYVCLSHICNRSFVLPDVFLHHCGAAAAEYGFFEMYCLFFSVC